MGGEAWSQSWSTFLVSAHVAHAGPRAGALRHADPASLQRQEDAPPGLAVLALAPIPGNLLGQ